MEIFKYTSRKHEIAALESGSIRIGTLFDYRDIENYGVQIGDAREGRINFAGTLENVTYEITAGHPVLERLVKLAPGARIGTLQVTNFSFESENLYVFSASESFSVDALEQWNEDPHAKYDACYQINSARLFFRAISNALKGKAEFLGFTPVHYYDASVPVGLTSPLARMHPGQLKGGTTHGHQQEIRAFWRPVISGEIQPLIIEVPEVCKYCTHKFSFSTN